MLLFAVLIRQHVESLVCCIPCMELPPGMTNTVNNGLSFFLKSIIQTTSKSPVNTPEHRSKRECGLLRLFHPIIYMDTGWSISFPSATWQFCQDYSQVIQLGNVINYRVRFRIIINFLYIKCIYRSKYTSEITQHFLLRMPQSSLVMKVLNVAMLGQS